jgi:hypothetical protein
VFPVRYELTDYLECLHVVWFRVLSDSDYGVITVQIADPFSRQRGGQIDTRLQISDSNIPTENNIWSQVPQGT